MDIIKQPILDVNALKIQGEELNEKTIKGTWEPNFQQIPPDIDIHFNTSTGVFVSNKEAQIEEECSLEIVETFDLTKGAVIEFTTSKTNDLTIVFGWASQAMGAIYSRLG